MTEGTPIGYAFGAAFVRGEAVVFNVSTRNHPDLWAVVDRADWHRVRAYRWSATKRNNGFYVRHGQMLLHRFLMQPPSGMTVDHADGDPRNNRRANLRVCTQAQNNTFGADRRRGGPKPTKVLKDRPPARPHVVKMRLADGSVREYVYPPRTKTRTNKGDFTK